MKELIKSEKMKALWTDLYLNYDIVVVDAPPVINEEYAVNLVHLSELSVYVVDSSKITKNLLDQALSYFEYFHVKPSGILLNRVLPLYIDDERLKLGFKKAKKKFWRS
jgi:Mrp family chromosome partitioning ATPase